MTNKMPRVLTEFLAPLTPCNLPVSRCPVPREEAERRILVMRTGAHGDLLMASPLLRLLRESYPQAHLTWIVERNEHQAIDANPYVDELLLWDSSAWREVIRRPKISLLHPWRFRRRLEGRHYDVFISLQAEEWPLTVRGVKATQSVGVFDVFFQYNHNRPRNKYAYLYDHAYTHRDLPPHRTDQFLLPLRALGLPDPRGEAKRMQIGYTAEDAAAVDQFLRRGGLRGGESYVVLAPMAKWPTRCWPAERYAQLADRLTAGRQRVVLIGSPREREAVRGVARAMCAEPITAAGDLSFREMTALIGRSSLLVSGDTGPMHVAAAVGTPYLALFGPTPVPERAPLAGRGLTLMHPVPCGPCDKDHCPLVGEGHMRCMRLITVDEALAAAEGLLQGQALPV